MYETFIPYRFTPVISSNIFAKLLLGLTKTLILTVYLIKWKLKLCFRVVKLPGPSMYSIK